MDSRSETERRHWVTEDYTTIRQLALQTLEDTTGKASPEVQWFLTQYETTLRRNIVPNDSEIGELARQIYLEHREAIELINSYKPNYAADIKQILKEAISQQDGWVLDEEGGAYVRFRSSNVGQVRSSEKRFRLGGKPCSAAVRNILPHQSGWNTGHSAYSWPRNRRCSQAAVDRGRSAESTGIQAKTKFPAKRVYTPERL